MTLDEGNINILDKAWVMYNVTIEPEDEETDEDLTTGRVSVPAPVPGVEEYLVYEVQETKVEEIEYVYVNEYIVVDCWNFNYNYLVTTEESFDVVDYYESADADTTIPDHINIGEKLVPFEDIQFVEYKYATDPTTGEERIVGMISDGGEVLCITADNTKFLGLFYVVATLYDGSEEQIVNVPQNFEIIVDERLLPLDENGFATIPGRGSYTISLIDRGDPNIRLDFVVTKLDPAGTEYTADFGSFSESGVSDSHYADRTNDEGWTVTNARCDGQAIDLFNTSDQITLNGVTSNPGKLTSALIKDGSISSLKFNYGYAFNENRTISLTINIKNAEGEIVATTTLLDTTVTQQVGESFIWTLDETYVGDFTIEIINNCPSGSASTYKDRVSIADLYWYAWVILFS